MMALAIPTMVGCGPPKNAPVVRPAQMTDPALFEQPVWIAFKAGDELPVYVDLGGPLWEIEAPKPLTMKIHQDVFLLLGDGMPRLSYDRETFIDGGGSFSFGIGNSKKLGPHIRIVVRHLGDRARDGERGP